MRVRVGVRVRVRVRVGVSDGCLIPIYYPEL